MKKSWFLIIGVLLLVMSISVFAECPKHPPIEGCEHCAHDTHNCDPPDSPLPESIEEILRIFREWGHYIILGVEG